MVQSVPVSSTSREKLQITLLTKVEKTWTHVGGVKPHSTQKCDLSVIIGVSHTGKETFDRQMALQMIHFSLPDMADVHQRGHKQAFKSAHTPVLISNEALEE